VIKIERVRWAGNIASIGAVNNAYKILVEKSKGTRPPGRPTRRWEDNIRIDLGEIVWEVVDWIHLAQDRDHWRAPVNTAMNLRDL